ncbi:hypothetical protein [uncultured Methylobacterium sp.]|uniref:hypothetical protein n=1 Tax=uncultured Methylobacterium sp. TaxID=157278 RepID=UPI0035C94C35
MAELPKLSAVGSGHKLGPVGGICAIAWSNTAGSYVITNDHVVRNIRTGQIRPDIVIEDEGGRFRGLVSRSTGVTMARDNEHDAAIVSFAPEMRIYPWSVPEGRIAEVGEIGQGKLYQYNVDGLPPIVCRAIAKITNRLAFDVPGSPGLVYYCLNFWILQVERGTTLGGHSGALLHRGIPGGALAAGLLFARLEQYNQALAFSANAEWKALGLI